MIIIPGFIGYARDIYEIITYRAVDDTEDDQLFYTNIFLQPELRVRVTQGLNALYCLTGFLHALSLL